MNLAASVFEWTKHLRYVRVKKTTKLVGLMLATFANPDGTEAYPGVARLSVACGMDYKTVKRALAELLAAGLIVKADGHTGMRGRYDIYYLTLPDGGNGVLSPDEFNNEVERVREANRRKPGTGNGGPRTSGGVRATSDPVPESETVAEAEEVRGLSVPQNDEVRGNSVPQYGDFLSAVPIPTPEPVITSPSSAANLIAAVTVPGDPTPDQDPDISDEKPRLRLVHGRRGLGFCWPCYGTGRTTLAVDPVNGDACALHLREKAS